MALNVGVIRSKLRAPVAGAVAGVAFSILLMTSLVLVRLSIPTDLRDTGAWMTGRLHSVTLAVQLVPFAAIAFLWFIGVLRHRLGDLEDRLFASVLLGSGLLFLAMLLAASAVTGALLGARALSPGGTLDPATYTFAHALAHEILYVNAMRLAGVFMISTSSISLRTGIVPRWMARLGLGLALVLLFGLSRWPWIPVVFPAWVFLVSTHVLIANLRGGEHAAAA